MEDQTININDLIKKCINHDQASCRTLYLRFKNSLFSICLRYADTRALAEDYLQEGFITIFKNLNKYNPEKGAFYTWASKVLINQILMLKRKNKISFESEDKVLPMNVKVNQTIVSKLQLKELILLIQKLPDGFRTVFNLYEIEGHTHKEISVKLNISESTSKTQLMRAKLLLRKKIEADDFTPIIINPKKRLEQTI